MNETQLAEKGIEYLQGFGWDVYQEVAFEDRVADIVAVRGPVCWVVEVKTSRTLTVLEQAHYWLPAANRVSILVPVVKRHASHWLYSRVARDLGIGILEAFTEVREDQPARTRSRLPGSVIYDFLEPEHKTFAKAGNADGMRWSPWRRTMLNCADYVRKNPGCTLHELVKGVHHHYANDTSANGSMRAWADSGNIEGVETRRENGRIRLYVKDTD